MNLIFVFIKLNNKSTLYGENNFINLILYIGRLSAKKMMLKAENTFKHKMTQFHSINWNKTQIYTDTNKQNRTYFCSTNLLKQPEKKHYVELFCVVH